MSDAPYWSADGVLAQLGIFEPEDIDIEAVAQYCGATVVYERLSGCTARILGYGDRAVIGVDESAPRPRQRFSAGHELGHWMYDRGRASFSCRDKDLTSHGSEESREVRANGYAADLLLPPRMFVPRAENQEITFATARVLAGVFTTSLSSTAIRLVELGSYPSMIVCTEPSRRRWFARSPSVPERLWPVETPGHESVAHELHRGGNDEGKSVDVGAENWVDHPDACRYTIREDSIRLKGGSVLSLIWWKNERQLMDVDGDEPEEEDE